MEQHAQSTFPASCTMFDSCRRSVVGDILVKKGSSVIWCSEGGNKHVRQFSCSTEPLDAIFCSFPSISDGAEKMDVAVAILLTRDHLCLHQTNGESFEISLDFEVECMFATTDGLLIQSCGDNDRRRDRKLFGSLYALPHPVTLVRPVTIASSFLDVDSMSVDNSEEVLDGARNDSAVNLSLRNSLSPSQNPQARGQYHGTYESSNRVVAVLDNIVITCQQSGDDYGGSNINMWVLQPLLATQDDTEKMDQHRVYQEAAESNGLPPLPPSSSKSSTLQSFRSISDGRQSHGGAKHGSPVGWNQNKPERSDSPTLSSLMAPTGPTEVLENALGVSTSLHSVRQFGYDGLSLSEGHRAVAGNRSPVQHLLGYGSEQAHGSGAVGHSMLSGLSANSVEEESFAVINALSNADLSLVLLDSTELAIDSDVACEELEVHFTGHAHATGGLLLHVLHAYTGFHACYSIVTTNKGRAGGSDGVRRVSGGSLVALPGVQFSRPPASLASCSIPLFPWTAADPSTGLSVPLTLALLSDHQRGEPDEQVTPAGSKVAVLVGATCIGEIDLKWDDDLDIDLLLSSDANGGNSNIVTARRLLTCSSPTGGYVAEDMEGVYHAVSFDSALLTLGNEAGSRASAEVIVSVLAVLQNVASVGTLDAEDQLSSHASLKVNKRREYAAIAEHILGLLIQCNAILGRNAGVPLLVHSLFGSPLDDVPEIAAVVSKSSPRSPVSEALIVALYTAIARSIDSLSDSAGGGGNLRCMLFDALHSALEDVLLSSPGSSSSDEDFRAVLRAVERCTARAGGAPGKLYSDYYARLQHGEAATTLEPSVQEGGIKFTKFVASVPSAVDWIARCLANIEKACASGSPSNMSSPSPRVDDVATLPFYFIPPRLKGTPRSSASAPCSFLRTTKKFLKELLQRVFKEGGVSPSSSGGGGARRRARLVADAYVKSNSNADESIRNLSLLPFLLQVVVESALHACRESPNVLWPDSVLNWIGREDLSHYHRRKIAARPSTSAQRASDSASRAKEGSFSSSAYASDGLDEVEAAASLRFAEDDRMHEAGRMLRSSASIYLRLEKAPETADLDHRHQLQLRLLSLCRRSLACSVGRGMLTLGSLEPLIAAALPVPPLNLTGRVPPNNSIVHLDTASAPTELTLWPDFHNGAAAGLRVGLGAAPHDSDDDSRDVKITRYWIIYNRTAAAAAAAAALATKNNSNTAASNNNVSTESAISSHAGVLLALGLQGHLSVLSKGDICDYLTQGHEPTTIAMLIGIAASKLGSADPHMSKTLCLYIPTLLPPRHWDINISPLVQTAALAGLGLLHAGSGHRLITEFLLAELSRRPPSDRCDNRETMALAASWALGLVLLGKGGSGSGTGSSAGSAAAAAADGMEGLLDLRIDDRLCQLFTGGKKPEESHLFPSAISLAADGGSRATRILEGDEINTDLTAPGALIALALIYIKSNNTEIARRMAVPETMHSLDSVRPDLLLYRALGVCLVLWDSVEPSETWIDAQVPAPIDKVLFPDKHAATGVAKEKSPRALPNYKSRQLSSQDALHLYMCVVTGYCFGMGLVYAGTSDERAKKAILSKLRFLQKIRDNRLNLDINPPLLLDRSVKPLVDMCISVVAISLSVVMAGTGDVECLRIVRELRWKVDDVSFGTHLALSMSIGMLFLAGGNASVKRDPLSIACLLLSICPRFPARTVDNQYHMQAFRHLYVIAVESRVLKSIDVDTGEPVPMTVDMTLKDGRRMPIRAPCLLPELATIASLSINGGGDDGYASYPKNATDDDTSPAMVVDKEAPRRKLLDLFCSPGKEGAPQHSAASELFPLELRLGSTEATKGGSSLHVQASEVQNLKVKRKDSSVSALTGESASQRLEGVVTDLIRAKMPSQPPALPERAGTDREILEETYLRMLKAGSSDGAWRAERVLSGAVEKTSLFNFL